MQISPGKNDHPMYLPKFTTVFLGCMGLRLVRQTRPNTTASNWVRVLQVGTLPQASSRFHLIVDTLALSYRLVLPTSVRDLHPRVIAHAGRTVKEVHILKK